MYTKRNDVIVLQEMPIHGFSHDTLHENMDMKISYVLRQLGLGFHMKGYTYIKRGVQLALEDADNGILITKYMYPALAKEFNTTSTAVERVIRTAIQGMDCDDSVKSEFLGRVKKTYTNKEFIMAITELIHFNA